MKITVIIAALSLVAALASGIGAQELHGRAAAMPGYFDCELHTILHKDIPEAAAEAVLERNGQVNLIFTFPDGSNLDVVDALPGPGYNPLWQEVEVTWNTTPHLLCSAEQIFAAEASGEVSLEFTDELESCPIAGH